MIPTKYLQNLDGLFPADLREIATGLHSLTLEGEPSATRFLLIDYCQHKIRAMENRAFGDIRRAIALQVVCESIYKKLPEYARW